MKIIPDRRLFWFLREGMAMDLKDPSTLDLYVQQVLSRGKSADVKTLLKTVNPSAFQISFQRVKNFLSSEVRNFWEDFLADRQSDSGRHS